MLDFLANLLRKVSNFNSFKIVLNTIKINFITTGKVKYLGIVIQIYKFCMQDTTK